MTKQTSRLSVQIEDLKGISQNHNKSSFSFVNMMKLLHKKSVYIMLGNTLKKKDIHISISMSLITLREFMININKLYWLMHQKDVE